MEFWKSKTLHGLGGLLLVTLILAYTGKLQSSDIADILKWIGTAFLTSRAVDNAAQKIPNKGTDK